MDTPASFSSARTPPATPSNLHQLPKLYELPTMQSSSEASAIRKTILEACTKGLERNPTPPRQLCSANRRVERFREMATDKTAPLTADPVRTVGILRETSRYKCYASFSPPSSPPSPPALQRSLASSYPVSRLNPLPRAVAWYQAYQKGKLTHDELWEMLQFDQSSWRAELHDAEKRVLEQQELRELAATIHFGTSSESSMSDRTGSSRSCISAENAAKRGPVRLVKSASPDFGRSARAADLLQLNSHSDDRKSVSPCAAACRGDISQRSRGCRSTRAASSSIELAACGTNSPRSTFSVMPKPASTQEVRLGNPKYLTGSNQEIDNANDLLKMMMTWVHTNNFDRRNGKYSQDRSNFLK